MKKRTLSKKKQQQQQHSSSSHPTWSFRSNMKNLVDSLKLAGKFYSNTSKMKSSSARSEMKIIDLKQVFQMGRYQESEKRRHEASERIRGVNAERAKMLLELQKFQQEKREKENLMLSNIKNTFANAELNSSIVATLPPAITASSTLPPFLTTNLTLDLASTKRKILMELKWLH